MSGVHIIVRYLNFKDVECNKMKKEKNIPNNIAYIDGQNLFMGTTKSEPSWHIDLSRFRVYLKNKYGIEKAYYHLGYINDGEVYQNLYESIQSAGFVLVFREHNSAMMGAKKGNVDSNIVTGKQIGRAHV